MKLKKLIGDLPIQIYRGGKEVEITGLCAHSKFVCPGNLFIAKKGTVDDGSRYIEEAIDSGAAAILTDLPNPFLKVVQLVHPDIRAIEGELAANFYGHPSKSLFAIGITGTNGKTSVGHFVKHFLDQAGRQCGLIGTIEYIVGEHRFEASLTTPDVITNNKLLSEMKKRDCKAVAMEVTSIGLEQGRVDNIDFDAAVFTNLTQDHLDYHKSLEAYAKSKQKLFSMLSSNKTAIMNIESSWTSFMLEDCKAKVITYGFSKDADLYAYDMDLKISGSVFKVRFQDQEATFQIPQIGAFNVLNCLAALAVCLDQGVPLGELSRYAATCPPVTGRMEKVENANGLNIFVDYAHTPDALEKTLKTLREVTAGKVMCVFGCGGNRDKGKRKLMGQISDQYADFTWITSDNPRSEDPRQICEQIAEGFRSKKFSIETDRRKAIEAAVRDSSSGDVIVIAGKGHETHQIFSHQTIPFDDKQVVLESFCKSCV